jgi:single-strand DNA-binding protein
MMSKSVNKVILLGHMGKDAEVKSLPSGVAVANFSLATTERYKDKSGEWQDKTEWHNLVAYKRAAEIIRDYTAKGAKLYVEGRLTTRSWDDKDTGKKLYRTEIVIGDITLLSDSKNGNGHSNGPESGPDRSGGRDKDRSESSGSQSRRHDDYSDGLGIDESDIPF